MAHKRKDFYERKTTVGVSLSNLTLKMLDEFCSHYGFSRSAVIDAVLNYFSDNYDDFYTTVHNMEIRKCKKMRDPEL